MDNTATHAPRYLITGGMPLQGEAVISGAKNAVTKMLIASLLTKEQSLFQNVPLLGDLDLTMKMCEDIGSQTHLEDHTLTIYTPEIRQASVSSEIGGLNRLAVMTIGPLLHRCGEVTIPRPGGDR